MNEITTTVVGNLVVDPRLSLVGDSFKATFRIASTPRWFNAKSNEWQDGTTTYVNVNCWRKLAENANDCLRKGQPVIVHGRLSQREYETKDGERRSTLEIDATNIGHDLSRTIAVSRKLARTSPEGAAAEETNGGDNGDDAATAFEPTDLDVALSAGPEGLDEEFEEELVGV